MLCLQSLWLQVYFDNSLVSVVQKCGPFWLQVLCERIPVFKLSSIKSPRNSRLQLVNPTTLQPDFTPIQPRNPQSQSPISSVQYSSDSSIESLGPSKSDNKSSPTPQPFNKVSLSDNSWGTISFDDVNTNITPPMLPTPLQLQLAKPSLIDTLPSPQQEKLQTSK